jgi:hypothetical protein
VVFPAARDVLALTLALPAGFSPDGLAEVDVVLRRGCANDASHNGADNGTRSNASSGDATDYGA